MAGSRASSPRSKKKPNVCQEKSSSTYNPKTRRPCPICGEIKDRMPPRSPFLGLSHHTLPAMYWNVLLILLSP